ncbi:MAG: hypothetical protein V3S82_00510 [Dehalococcoidia bacterium]
METAIISVICIALLVLGWSTMSRNYISSVDSATVELGLMTENSREIVRTDLSTLTATQPSADLLDVTLRNTGQVKLGSFDRWDVIVQYTDSGATYYVKWLTYTTGVLGDNEWKKTAIYVGGTTDAEVFEPGILNPGEDLKFQVKLNPTVGTGTDNLVIISTPNGIAASIAFTGF